MTAPTTFEIGSALGSIATLTSLGAIEPESQFIDYSTTVKTGSGKVRGLGLPSATWHYGYLYQAQYDALRAFCPTAGASVCIATLNNDMDYVRYNGFMEFPTQFVVRSPEGRKVYIDVTITFTGLTAAE
jgi:hypothetical protein